MMYEHNYGSRPWWVDVVIGGVVMIGLVVLVWYTL